MSWSMLKESSVSYRLVGDMLRGLKSGRGAFALYLSEQVTGFILRVVLKCTLSLPPLVWF
jgi:hypothetical protein